MKLQCRVNGEEVAADVEPRLLLSDFIRHELRLTARMSDAEWVFVALAP